MSSVSSVTASDSFHKTSPSLR